MTIVRHSKLSVETFSALNRLAKKEALLFCGAGKQAVRQPSSNATITPIVAVPILAVKVEVAMFISQQDIINLLLLGIFILPFVIVIRQLFIEDSREGVSKESEESSNKKE